MCVGFALEVNFTGRSLTAAAGTCDDSRFTTPGFSDRGLTEDTPGLFGTHTQTC